MMPQCNRMLKYNLKDIWLIKELFVEGREDGRKDKT
jgi:hypothetical protein